MRTDPRSRHELVATGEQAIKRVDYESDVVDEMIEELQREYVVRYGGRDETPVDPTQFRPPSGTFLLMTIGSIAVGCAGLRRHDQSSVEVKRMFVRSEYRGRGLSRGLLQRIEREAGVLGYSRIVMETGLKQPEAMHLYETSGYQPIPGFGHYANAPQNRCYAKAL